MTWKVEIEDEAALIFESKELTDDDKVVIQKWAETVTKYGPQELQHPSTLWNDHALSGNWRGYRSSSFSYSGRIIYKIEDEVVTVVVVRITTTHNYKKKD